MTIKSYFKLLFNEYFFRTVMLYYSKSCLIQFMVDNDFSLGICNFYTLVGKINYLKILMEETVKIFLSLKN